MIDKFCEYLTNKIRNNMPEIDDERAEVIMYGIQLIVGEIPKIFLMLIVALILNIFWQTMLAFFLILPYKAVSGGFHLKSHLGCFVGTIVCYCGNAILSSLVELPINIKIVLILFNLFFGMIMITKYAPADTINLPILTRKERKTKRILSYIFLIINMALAYFIPNTTVSNIFIFGSLIQTFSITRLAYKLTKNEYGYEAYQKENAQTI